MLTKHKTERKKISTCDFFSKCHDLANIICLYLIITKMSCKLYFVQTNILHRVMSISDILELYLITALYAKMKLF